MLNECRLPADPGPGDILDQPTIMVVPAQQAPRVKAVPLPAEGGSLSGRSISHYQIKELIGRGSFGEVYRAVDPRLGREVAIKVAEPSIAENPALREVFWNEARIQARLEHSNIVPIYDLLEDSGRLVMVMRLIHGEDLDKRLRQMVRPFTPIEMLRVLRPVSSALGTAHDRAVIHQDLKPGNIRLTPSGEAVVLDFGVARITGKMASDRMGPVGTPGYMSPEQIRGEGIDARSDIYSLAMTLYKTLTGRHPFEEARDVTELLAWHLSRVPPSPTHYNDQLPGALGEVILQGLAKDPRDRFRACTDFARAISASLGLEDAVEETARDGRWDPRAKVSLDAQVLLHGDEPVAARTLDVSTSGAALQLTRPLEVGDRTGLVIRIPLKASAHLVRCSMKVLRAIPEPDGARTGLRVGVAFECLEEFDRAVLRDFVRAVLIFKGESGFDS